MGKTKRKKRRRVPADKQRKKKGILVGMHSGFKNVAKTVSGQETKQKSRLGTVITTALFVGAAILLYMRFFA